MRRSKLSKDKQLKLIELFIAGATARTAAELININKNSAILYYSRIRQLIKLSNKKHKLAGEIEADESYFGGHRKGKRGRGAGDKIAVFGMIERGGSVVAYVVSDTKSSTLTRLINQNVAKNSTIYTDTYRSYSRLKLFNYDHFMINHSEQFADKHVHTNSIENFWRQAKRNLKKYNGIAPNSFDLFLDECVFKFNNRKIKAQMNIITELAEQHLF